MSKTKAKAGEGTPNRKHAGHYAVGYSKPPRASQFQKGRSGNPKGRPKRRTDLGALVVEALNEQIRVVSGGTGKTISKEEAILTALVNSALQGDARALRSLVKLAAKTGILKPIVDELQMHGVISFTREEEQELARHPEKFEVFARRAVQRRNAETLKNQAAARRIGAVVRYGRA